MMKKTICALFLPVLIVCLSPVQAQEGQIAIMCTPLIEQSTISQERHLEKSKKQKKFGNILLGVGVGVAIIGAVIPQGELIADYYPDRHTYDRLKAVLITGGAITAVASIPLFIASKKNRKRGTSVGVHIEKAQRLAGRNLLVTSIPAFALKVYL